MKRFILFGLALMSGVLSNAALADAIEVAGKRPTGLLILMMYLCCPVTAC